MAEILGLGLSHYPPLCLPEADMAGILRWTLRDPSIPAAEKDVAKWPAPMRAEWGDDFGARLASSDFVETHVFNSNKVFAVYRESKA